MGGHVSYKGTLQPDKQQIHGLHTYLYGRASFAGLREHLSVLLNPHPDVLSIESGQGYNRKRYIPNPPTLGMQ